MTQTVDIVQKLWTLCNDLRDEGIIFHRYVTELTYLLFLKMVQETGQEKILPTGFRWGDLEGTEPPKQLDHYRQTLIELGGHSNPLIHMIYKSANTLLRKPATLNKIVASIDALDWYNARKEGLGDLYEGLLAKNATESKSGAGQYFTARPLVDSIVAVMKPQSSDVIQDPAAGTGGFLIAAYHYIMSRENTDKWKPEKWKNYIENTFYGMELVPDTQRLALMNLAMHGLANNPDQSGVYLGDTLSDDYKRLGKATLILSNPPFGKKKSSNQIIRNDLPFPTGNKQLAFLQHIYLALKPGGRAAVIIPDTVLSEGGIAEEIRIDLMEKCNLHTILRLPVGIFYAHGVKTNVLFFTRGKNDKKNTREVWVYDLRANTPAFGKRTPLTRAFFSEFEAAFGIDFTGSVNALAKRQDTGFDGRFRKFTREQINERNNNLAISWLKPNENSSQNLGGPTEIAENIISDLESAIESMQNILQELKVGQELESEAIS